MPAEGGVAGLLAIAAEMALTTEETVLIIEGGGGEPAGTPFSLVNSVFGLVT